MRSRKTDPVDTISDLLFDLGINDFAKVSILGSIIRVEVIYEPLQQERENLLRFKSRLRNMNKNQDPVGKHLIKQIEYFIERLDRISLAKVLVTAASSDGIEKLRRQLILIQKEIEIRQRKAREMRRLIRSLSSYIREYLRSSENSSF